MNHIHGYQRLAKMMNELEMFDDQLRFVRLEMRARRRVEKWFPAGLMNHAYELICDYGFGLGRILAIWAGHVAVGAALLFVPKLIETLKNGGGAGWQPAKESIIDLLLALVLSFTNAHGPLGLYRTYFQETAWKLKSRVSWPLAHLGLALAHLGRTGADGSRRDHPIFLVADDPQSVPYALISGCPDATQSTVSLG